MHTNAKVLESADALEWAKKFMRLFGHRLQDIDEGLMIAWFANAIMNGYDTARRRYEPSTLAGIDDPAAFVAAVDDLLLSWSLSSARTSLDDKLKAVRTARGGAPCPTT